MRLEDAVGEHGVGAYSCAVDGAALQAVPGAPALWCPRCDHRTDAPGAGVLGDGFDVVHRQWGLRGDPHLWAALRDRVAATPTPATEAAIREAFVDALGAVAGFDLDATTEAHVHRPELDHGGMSGGTVDVGWWRTKGIPLLVARALARRPTPSTAVATPSAWPPLPPVPPPLPPTTSPAFAAPDAAPTAPPPAPSGGGNVVVTVAIWLVVLAIPAALVGGGAFLLHQRAVGTWVEATVLDCDTRRSGSGFRTDCTAEWTEDGRSVVGTFTGGNGESDVGDTVAATVRGDTAYSRSLVLPILLLVLGLPFLALPLIALRNRFRPRRSPTVGT